jgi:hypothetical protein
MQRALTTIATAPYQRQDKTTFPQLIEKIAKLKENAALRSMSLDEDQSAYALKLRQTSDMAAFDSSLSEFLDAGHFPDILMFRTMIGGLGWFGHMDYAQDIYDIAMQAYSKNRHAFKITAQLLVSAAACQRQDIIDHIQTDMRFLRDAEINLVIDRVFLKDKVLAGKIYDKFHFKLNSRTQYASGGETYFRAELLEADNTPTIDLHNMFSGPAYIGLKKYILDIPIEPARDVQLIIITGRGLHSRGDYQLGQNPMRLVSEQVCHDLFQDNPYSLQSDYHGGSFLLTVSTNVLKKIQLNAGSSSSSTANHSVELASPPSPKQTIRLDKVDVKAPTFSRQNDQITPTPMGSDAHISWYLAQQAPTPKADANQDEKVEISPVKLPATPSVQLGNKNKKHHHKKKPKEDSAPVVPHKPRRNPCQMFRDKMDGIVSYFSNFKKNMDYLLEREERMEVLREKQEAQRALSKRIKAGR